MFEKALLKSISKNSLALGAFALVTVLLLSWVNDATRDEIQYQRREAEKKALYELLPAATHNNDLLEDTLSLSMEGKDSPLVNLELLGLKEDKRIYIAKQDGAVIGVILPATASDGYSGDINLIVGIRADNSIAGVRIVQHRETPGLGDKVELKKSPFAKSSAKRLGCEKR